jgi:hypothetical protein
MRDGKFLIVLECPGCYDGWNEKARRCERRKQRALREAVFAGATDEPTPLIEKRDIRAQVP